MKGRVSRRRGRDGSWLRKEGFLLSQFLTEGLVSAGTDTGFDIEKVPSGGLHNSRCGWGGDEAGTTDMCPVSEIDAGNLVCSVGCLLED